MPESQLEASIEDTASVESEVTRGTIVQNERLKNRRSSKMALGLSNLEEQFPSIRFNQLNGLQAFTEFIKSGETDGYFRMPTGAGKTILLSLIASMLDEITLILVPSVNLLESTKREMERVGIDAKKIGIVGDGNNDNNRQFTIMTYKSFLSKGAPKGTSTYIFDEVHRSLGDRTRQRINMATEGILEFQSEIVLTDEELEDEDIALKQIHRLETQALKLGFTATPQLGSKNVEEVHGKLIAETSYAELVDAAILKQVEVHDVSAEMDAVDESSYMSIEKEEKLLNKAAVYKKILEEYVQFRSKFNEYPLRTVAFCHSVEACQIFADLASKEGLNCAVVTGKSGDLAEAERKLLSGEIDIIVTVNKLMEGWDFPPINSVLWLRGSWSPAALIQGVGRGMRAYSNESFMHLFETQWQVRGASFSKLPGDHNSAPEKPKNGANETENIRPSSYALTFAQALAILGEDVGKIISNADHLKYLHYCNLNHLGLGTLQDGTEVTGLEGYCKARNIKNTTLNNWLVESGVIPMKGVKGRVGTHIVDVFKKTEIDAVMEIKRPEEIVILDEDGSIKLEGIGDVVGLHAYAIGKSFTKKKLERWINKASPPLLPIQGIKGRYEKKNVPLYLKEGLDALVTKMLALESDESFQATEGDQSTSSSSPKDLTATPSKETKNLVQLDQNGIGTLADGTEVVGLVAYSRHKKLHDVTFKKWIEEAGLQAIEGIQGLRPPSRISVYLKTQVDALIESKQSTKTVDLNDKGIATLEDGRIVVGLHPYAFAIDMTPPTLLKLAKERNVPTLSGIKGKRGWRVVDLYLKELIDQELPLQLDQNGVGVLPDGTEVVSLSAYLADKRIEWKKMKNKMLEENIKALPGRRGIRSHSSAELYRKAEIDSVISELRNWDRN